MAEFTILITTKNRLEDLKFSLQKLDFSKSDFQCIICDDGSTDGTYDYIKNSYPEIELIQNAVSKGLIYSRNRLMSLVKTPFAISLDDDLHFITADSFQIIKKYFNENPKVGLLGFRIFWGLNHPFFTEHSQKPHRTKSFAGGAHAWRMSAWQQIPNYPEWFVFYGEEDFAAYQLFKKNIEIHYLPDVLVHHRVDLKARKNHADYLQRSRRALRAGWFLILMFYPKRKILKQLGYSVYAQIKNKVFRGDLKILVAILLALADIFRNAIKIHKNKNRFSQAEFLAFQRLNATEIYWFPSQNKIDTEVLQ